jgi:hypothetical protein
MTWRPERQGNQGNLPMFANSPQKWRNSMAVAPKQLCMAVAMLAIIGNAFCLSTSAYAQGAYRLGSSQWDAGGGNHRWTYGPGIAWYSANSYPYFGSYGYGSYYYWSEGYGPFAKCGWSWRTYVNRRGHLIATNALCR